MSILQEIQSWSVSNLAPWQQDAVRRLYADRELDKADKDDLFALCKAEHGIEDPENRVAVPLDAAQVTAPPVPSRLVQLVAIKQLKNVNALAEEQSLPIAPTGLTVIYGENGAGKSGYTRVLKKACRARDQGEPILPDGRKQPGQVGPASAVFDAAIDGADSIELAWTADVAAPEQLSEIAIFDARCARAYIDNQGDFAYVPYGLDILEGLVALCHDIKSQASQEKLANALSVKALASLAEGETDVARLLQTLEGEAKASEVEALAELSDLESARLETLVKARAESDPKKEAAARRLLATRLDALASRVAAAAEFVSGEALTSLKELVEASNSAKEAAELAARGFKETPGLLPGTGGEAWRELIEAARTFATESHVGHVFPELQADSGCPLCQNPLGDEGLSRLRNFDGFLEQAAETASKTARALAVAPYQKLKAADLQLGFDPALVKELTDSDPSLATSVAAFQVAVEERRDGALRACGSDSDWTDVVMLPAGVDTALGARVAALTQEAETLEKLDDADARSALVAEHAELDARLQLAGLKTLALQAIAKREHCSKLDSCIESCGTANISKKSTGLSKTMATQEVVDALNTELKALNAHELRAVMKPQSPGGKTRFKLALQLPGGGAPAAILSEGEQRAVAIASFLGELSLGQGRGGIVFDDPVSSLDHRHRWAVAERLAREAQQRQVIVFTHDIYFLCVMQQKARELGTELVTQCLRRTQAGFGVPAADLPFDQLGTKKRVGRLRESHTLAKKAHASGDSDEARKLTRGAYTDLRLAWERAVEEVLLSGVVERFNEGVATKKLSSVSVEDSDYEDVTRGMTKSSKFAHDAAMSAQMPTPHPDDLQEDIEKFATWFEAVKARKTAVEKRRKLP